MPEDQMKLLAGMVKKIKALEEKLAAYTPPAEALYKTLQDIKGEKGDEGKDGKDSKVPGPKGGKGDQGKEGPQGKPGKDGKDGKNATAQDIVPLIQKLIPETVVVDEAQIITSVENNVGKNLPKLAGAIRDGLELLQGDDRLDISAIRGAEKLQKAEGGTRTGWGAHPITIAQSSTVKTKNARYLKFTGATVTQGGDGVTTIAVTGGSGWTIETPTGAVNSSNKTYTVSATPQYIVIDGITYFENNGYTLAALTITTTVAPTGFIRSVF